MRFEAKNFKIVDQGGDLSGASAKELYEDGVEVSISEVVYEAMKSTSPIVDEEYKIGTEFELTGHINSSSLDDLAIALDTTNSSGITINATESAPQKKGKKDAQFDVVLPSDAANSTGTWKLTYLIIQVDKSKQFQVDEATYFEISLKGSADTALTITQS